MTTCETIHPFESAGLGIAPFSLAGFSEKVYSPIPGICQPAGTCDFCGNGIRYCCHIRSHDGREFIVGTDCVLKLGRDDNRLCSDVEREVAKAKKAQRDAKRQAEWEKRQAARVAAQQVERDRNGGLTDAEIRQQQADAAARQQAERMREENAWLLDVLDAVPYQSSFVDGMKESLLRSPACDLSDKCLVILADIYAKTKTDGARRNSKQYTEALNEFGSKTDKD